MLNTSVIIFWKSHRIMLEDFEKSLTCYRLLFTLLIITFPANSVVIRWKPTLPSIDRAHWEIFLWAKFSWSQFFRQQILKTNFQTKILGCQILSDQLWTWLWSPGCKLIRTILVYLNADHDWLRAVKPCSLR